MTDRELEVLLTGLESDRVERKASAADRDKIREAICAFANAHMQAVHRAYKEYRALAAAIAERIGLPLAGAR